jgi:hypothetical protein
MGDHFRQSDQIMPCGHILRSGIGDAVQRTLIREPPIGELPSRRQDCSALASTYTQAHIHYPRRIGFGVWSLLLMLGFDGKVSRKCGQEDQAGTHAERPSCAASKCDHPSRLFL